MMMSLLPAHLTLNSHKEFLCDYKMYTLFKNGLYKTCGRGKAIELLKDGWHDQTKYNPKEEVLKYEIQQQQWPTTWDARKTNAYDSSAERQHEEIGSGSKSCSERQEPRHEQHQSDVCDNGGKEHLLQTVRSGSECSQVIKKRGRPKRVI